MFCLFLNKKAKNKDLRPSNKEQNADLEFLSWAWQGKYFLFKIAETKNE